MALGSDASDLVAGDANGVTDVFVRILGTAPPPGATCRGLAATILGTEGPDTSTGTPGRDVVAALGGDDVRGDAGDDHDSLLVLVHGIRGEMLYLPRRGAGYPAWVAAGALGLVSVGLAVAAHLRGWTGRARRLAGAVALAAGLGAAACLAYQAARGDAVTVDDPGVFGRSGTFELSRTAAYPVGFLLAAGLS